MRLVAPLAIVVLSASPAVAQSDDVNLCRDLLKAVGVLDAAANTDVTAHEDGCTFTNLSVSLDHIMRYQIEALRVTAPGMDKRLSQNLPPETVELDATGIRVLPDAGDPLLEYVMELQVEPFDINLAYNWDGASGEFELINLSLAGDYLGRAALSGRASELTDAALADARLGMPVQVSLDSLSIVLENRALFTSFVAVPLIANMTFEGDPRAEVDAKKQATADMVAALPEAMLDAQSRAVLIDFIKAFPRPEGNYRLDIAFPEGFDPLPLMANPLGLLQDPPQMTIKATALD